MDNTFIIKVVPLDTTTVDPEPTIICCNLVYAIFPDAEDAAIVTEVAAPIVNVFGVSKT